MSYQSKFNWATRLQLFCSWFYGFMFEDEDLKFLSPITRFKRLVAIGYRYVVLGRINS
jgi:hypothetical protein